MLKIMNTVVNNNSEEKAKMLLYTVKAYTQLCNALTKSSIYRVVPKS